ncbi:MAG: hypothetical protein AVDCRST_MAG68-4941, partial [uncultured Gemmatimonadetes bacterium]
VRPHRPRPQARRKEGERCGGGVGGHPPPRRVPAGVRCTRGPGAGGRGGGRRAERRGTAGG